MSRGEEFSKQKERRKYEVLLMTQKIKILASLILILFAYSIGGYMLLARVSFKDAILMAFETLAFEHVAIATVVGRAFQLSILVFGGFILWFTLWTLFDLIIEGKLRDYLGEVIIMNKVRHMKKHYIICGGGRVGRHLVDLFIKNKMPYVLVDIDENTVRTLKRHKYDVVEADVTEEETLKKANIKEAKALIAVLPEIEKNIVLALTAKEMNPQIKVYARAEHEELVNRLRKAGADYVIMPEVICAENIMQKIKDDDTKNILSRLKQ
jgi:voltage-gated potassium channel